MYEEWEGERSQKFKGSRKIIGPRNQVESSPFITGSLGETSTGLECLKTKKHFPARYGKTLPD